MQIDLENLKGHLNSLDKELYRVIEVLQDNDLELATAIINVSFKRIEDIQELLKHE